MGYSPWGRKESDTTEGLSLSQRVNQFQKGYCTISLGTKRTKKILSFSSLVWETTNCCPLALVAWNDSVIKLLRACEKVEDTRIEGGGMGCCRLWREIETWDGGPSDRRGIREPPTCLPNPSASTAKHTGCGLSLPVHLRLPSHHQHPHTTHPTLPSFFAKPYFIFCFFLFQLLATKRVGLTNPMPWIPLAIRTINTASPIHQWLSQANTTSSIFQGRLRSHF